MFCVLKKSLIFPLAVLCLNVFAQEDIFNAKDLEGWSGSEIWKVEDSAITAEIKDGASLKKNEFLYFNEKLSDFELTLDYKISGPSANSGIQIRSIKDKNGHAAGYQCDLDKGKTWLGRIYDEHGRGLIVERGTLTAIAKDGKKHVFPFRDAKKLSTIARQDEWNEYKIVAKGNRIEVYINGTHFSTLEDYQDGQADLEGLIAFQIHSGEGPAKVFFKNIKLNRFSKEQQTKTPTQYIPEDMPNINFEKGDLSGWTASGSAFEKQPVRKGLIEKRIPGSSSNAEGSFFLGGYEIHLSDHATGTLSSKPFKVSHKWASLRVGGGEDKSTRVEIILKETNKVLKHFSGKNTEEMAVYSVNLEKYLGKEIFLKIVDENKNGWGHINYDGFFFTDSVAAGSVPNNSPVLRHLLKNPEDKNEGAGTTNRMYVPAGFKVETVVSPERVKQPIAFTFDAKGRIWVAEAYAYPRRQPKGKGKDRLVIYEDKDGDGSFESQKVFADNLNLISGFEIGYGGVWVAAAPEFLFIPDRDGDDKPDGEYEVLLDGWDTRDTHETPNSFLWGHDGWLYGNHGVFNNSMVGKPGTPRDKRVPVNAAVWRYHPVSHTFEIYSHGGSNQWGLDYNADGALFMTHCRSSWGRGPVSQVIRDGHYWTQNNSAHAEFIATAPKGWNYKEVPLNNTLFSAAAYGHGKGGAGDNESRSIFGGHSHVGTMIYLGDNWPQEYRHQLYTHNLHGGQLNREFLQRFDSGFLSHSYGRDQLFVQDNQYLAVDLKYGPDGSVYSIDWFDKQHCHTNKQEIWDRSNGGVYRMQYTKTFKPAKVFNLEKVNTRALIEYLDHENEWFSRMAQHVLRQRYFEKLIEKENRTLIEERLFDVHGKYRFRALTALYGVNGISEDSYSRLLSDNNEVIRAQAVHLITEKAKEFSSKFGAKLIQMAKEDPSSLVRLNLAAASQKRLDDTVALEIIENLSKKAADAEDRFIPKMLWFAYARFAKKDFEKAFKTADESPLPLFRKSIYWYAAKENRDMFLKQVSKVKSKEFLFEYLAILAQLLEGQKQVVPPADWLTVRTKAAEANPKSPELSLLDKIFDQKAVKVDKHKEQIARGKEGFALCAACHNPGKDLPGPALEEIAQTYSNKADIIKWVKSPGRKRQNYPQMPPFDKLSEDALDDIATYLLSLRQAQIIKFGKQTLSDLYYSEGANFADFNNDKKMDIVSGPYWYEAPEYKKKHEIYPVKAFSKTSGYANSFFSFPYDFNNDGWMDILAWGLPGSPATVYVNKQNKEGHWQAHKVFSSVGHESPVFADIDNDGQPELLCTHKGQLGFASFNKDKPFEEWTWQSVGKGNFVHGLGFGDINGDGRHDILGPGGWWQQPEKSGNWSFHPVNFGKGGAQMYAYDVDGDGDNDVITSLVAHGYGLAWFEQDKGKFKQHTIMGSKPEDNKYGICISQLHALELKDINGDGLKDIVTGKCYNAHNGRDPGAKDPAAMIYFELSRKNGTVEFIPREMDHDSGLGRLIAVGDINGDQLPDVVSANKKGAFLFTQQRKSATEEEYLADLPKVFKHIPSGPKTVQGLVEGENIKIVNYKGQCSAQNMKSWSAYKWSGDAQLWWRNGKPGDKMEMTFDLEKDSEYEFEIAFTKANDYAQVQLYLNDKKLQEPIDLYSSNVIHSGVLKLGIHKLKSGTQKLSIEILGANPKALKRYMVGLDFIKLTPKK